MNFKDITQELTQLERGLLFCNCNTGIMIGGHCGEGVIFHRKFQSRSMQDPKHPDEVFIYKGEIMKDGNSFAVVYRLQS